MGLGLAAPSSPFPFSFAPLFPILTKDFPLGPGRVVSSVVGRRPVLREVDGSWQLSVAFLHLFMEMSRCLKSCWKEIVPVAANLQ